MGLENLTFNEVHGEVPSVSFYTKESELDALVGGFIKRCIYEELLPEDIVILTSKTIENSWITADKQYGGQSLSTTKETGKILFTTIRKFKGLEAEAILIIDSSMSSLMNEENRRLLYVGSSRAKNVLSIAMLEDINGNDIGDFLRSIAPNRNVPKNKKGLKRLLSVSV